MGRNLFSFLALEATVPVLPTGEVEATSLLFSSSHLLLRSSPSLMSHVDDSAGVCSNGLELR